MTNRIRQCLALLLTLALCTTSVPVSAWAEATLPEVEEATEEVQETAVETQEALAGPKVLYRTHSLGAPSWEDEEGWNSYLTPQQEQAEDQTEDVLPEAEDTASTAEPFDSLQIMLLESTNGSDLTYRVRDARGEWQQDWTASPNAAICDLAITGVQAKLSEELDATYDLWYRAKDKNGEWMDWVRADEALETSDAEPLYGFTAVLVAEGTAPEESNDQASADEADTIQDETTTEEPGATDPQPDANPSEADSTAEEATDTTDEEIVVYPQSGNASETDATIEVVQPQTNNTTKSVAQAEQAAPGIAYRAYMQRSGWQSWVKNGKSAGAAGSGLRLEGLRFRLKNADGDISCRAHVQSIGWQKPVGSNQLVGTKGQSLRIEAIKLSLTGNIAQTHNVYYRVYVQGTGWQNWVTNGKTAGTLGKSLRIEAIEVLLVKKGDTIPANTTAGSKYKAGSAVTSTSVRYQSCVQGVGWQKEVANGKSSGATNQSSYIEALRTTVTGLDGGIKYRTRLDGSSWKKWSKNGSVSGAAGKSQKVEAIQMRLLGNAKSQYDVYYRVRVQSLGWMSWAKNGESAGSGGFGYGIEQVQVRLKKKTALAPSDDGDVSLTYLGNMTVSYSSRALKGSWQDACLDGATSGTVGQSGRIDYIRASLPDSTACGIRYSVCSNANGWQKWKSDGTAAGKSGQKITALRFKLSGTLAAHYDVWYRAHVAHVGWLGWTKNGRPAGSDSETKPIEAYEVQVLPKNSAGLATTQTAFRYSNQLNGVDISGWDKGINIHGLDADFVIIKATEGVTGNLANPAYYNPSYKTWADQALADGKLIGFYHYANGGDPIKEADWFYYAIKDYKGRAIACLDWEGQGNPTFDTGRDVAWCKKFLDRLKSKFGGTPLLYTSKNYTNAYDWSSVAKDYPLWGAQYPDYNRIYGYQSDPWQSSAPWGAWGTYPLIFQYTGTGVLQKNGGIDMFDFDLFYGSVSDWKALLK